MSEHSLQTGTWFKLICGASYQALPAIRSLAIAYSLAGADCIDVAADPAVMTAAKAGMDAAEKVANQSGRSFKRPWLMVSMSAGEDPHFRKAWFDERRCPADCPRPCERICPADAIDASGVVSDRCYGCGRCLPVCPLGLIEAKSQPTSLDAIAQQVLTGADALEIHTQVGHYSEFKDLWQTISPWTGHLKLISVSCPDGDGLIGYLHALRNILIHPAEQLAGMSAGNRLIVMWQTDGRPMSGDIGKGTTHAAIRLAQKVLASDVPGYVQLAGGTNQYTVPKLRALGLLNGPPNRGVENRRFVSGIAYGSYARHLLTDRLMSVIEQTLYLEEVSPALWEAVAIAESLVKPLKNQV